MSDLTQLNKAAFDDLAERYDAEPWQKKMTQLIKDGLQERKDWFGARWIRSGDTTEVRLLDYACGPGGASIALQPYVSKIVGVDLSDGMVAKFNDTFSRLGLSLQQAHAFVCDLATPDAQENKLEPESFDVVIISCALHHVKDPELLMKRLSRLLKPETGVLIVVDFLPFEHHHHGDSDHHLAHMAKTINRHGFDEEQMGKLYKHAGLDNFGFSVAEETVKVGEKGREMTPFFARGRK